MDGVGEVILLAVAAFAAGAVNAVAGGGSLITFPALLAVGYPAIDANVTNAVAVLPGYLGGSVAYRKELRPQGRRIVRLGAISAVGAVAGAALLLVLPEAAFELAAPVLILFAAALLGLKPRIDTALREHRTSRNPRLTRGFGTFAVVFAAAVYGGYFGAGLGLILLATLGLLLPDDLQRLNALKGALSLVIGAAGALVFAFLAPVAWPAAGLMAAGSYAGGHAGVGVARRLDADVLRRGIAMLGAAVAVVLLVT